MGCGVRQRHRNRLYDILFYKYNYTKLSSLYFFLLYDILQLKKKRINKNV